MTCSLMWIILTISIAKSPETKVRSHSKRFFDFNFRIADIIDIKPANMEELTEVITSACFHPTECNTLVYGSSKGTLRLCDLRSQALCDQHVKR